ncbi:uncharacterized protein NMK_2824 [Novimethylophilus kurashikiensis]|uniref:EF-hand domain-containing protein n=1 Tax=Novimethylophilus kurashikiensis TaxID=1825523 RepID=A0A2R5FFY3_9PROT|nr:EF-hand domain-containing protein [Novimethylophilus kurashikiensis]GBG15221.1 uncharacterized protein NMK_2824 [Novimethylophilus kurashikiensis]
MNKIGIFTLSAMLAFSPLAMANHDGSDGDHCTRNHRMDLSKADKNGDGFIDKEEAEAVHQQNFDEMDTNHDGKLSKEEIAACKRKCSHKTGMHEKGTQAFNKADKDNDGTLDREEAKKLPHVSKNFDAIDADKDGTVDREEIHQYMKDHANK